MSNTKPNRVGAWYPAEDVRATFEELNRFYPGYLRGQHKRGNMTYEQAVNRHSIFQLSQELVMQLAESGTVAQDFKEWLVWQRHIKLKELQAKEIAKAADLLMHIMGEDSVSAADVLEWLTERHKEQEKRWAERLAEITKMEQEPAALAA
jgi:hypothetical protein